MVSPDQQKASRDPPGTIPNAIIVRICRAVPVERQAQYINGLREVIKILYESNELEQLGHYLTEVSRDLDELEHENRRKRRDPQMKIVHLLIPPILTSLVNIAIALHWM